MSVILHYCHQDVYWDIFHDIFILFTLRFFHTVSGAARRGTVRRRMQWRTMPRGAGSSVNEP